MPQADDGTIIKTEAHEVDPVSSRISSSRKQQRRNSTWRGWLLSNILRLATWYSIITVLFRCPTTTTSLTSTDPKICRPYLSARNYADPYLEPYYQQYAAPYVQKAQPYLDTANTRVITPATVLAINGYDKFAAPQLSKVKEFTLSRWQALGVPHLRKAQVAAQQVYDQNLAPHVNKASEVATPYYETARDSALNVHENHIIPALVQSKPHLQSAYVTVQQFAIEKGLPFARHVLTNIIIFVDGTLWPFMRKVYADNIRPQLVMIRERIAKYQEGRKLQSAMEEAYVPSRAPSTSFENKESSLPIEAVSTITSAISETTTTTLPSTSTSIASASAATKTATDDTVAEDLTKWQRKFAEAADRGTDDLRERITDITQSLAHVELGEARGLSNALEKTAEVEVDTIKAKIISVITLLPEDANAKQLAAAETDVVQAIRDAAARVKEAAKKVRSWAQRFDSTLQTRLELATETTLQVLDDIRDLGLQEIGMRWAWMDGVTYKHWQKYHSLKKQFANWRSEVRDVALSHEAAASARADAERLLEEAMATTEHAAQEMIRLRDVAKWKIAARDLTDDFETREMPVMAAAVSAAASLTQDVKDAFVGSTKSAAAGADELLAEIVEPIVGAVSDKSASVTSISSSVAQEIADAETTVSSAVSSSTSILSSQAFPLLETTTTTFPTEIASNIGDSVDESSSIDLESSYQIVESGASRLSTAADSLSTSIAETVSSAALVATVGPSDVFSSASDIISSSAASVIASSSSSQVLKDKVDEAKGQATDISSSVLSE